MKKILIETAQWGKITSFVLFTIGLLLIGCNTDKAREKKEIDMLQSFYQEYIIEQSKVSTYNPQKIDSIKTFYCSAGLLEKLSQLELDYDPFLSAQDCDEVFLKRMTIKAETGNPGVYEVMFDNSVIDPSYENTHIRLQVAEGKISAIIGLTDEIKEGVVTENIAKKDSVSANELDYAQIQNNENLVPMLIPEGRYEIGTLESVISKTWMEFYRDVKTGEYHVAKAQYAIGTYHDDCLGLDQEKLKSSRNCLFYLNMPTLKETKVDSISIGTGYITPKHPFVINFNGSRYTLQAEAQISEDHIFNPDQEYGYWKKYRMTLKKDDLPEALLFNIPEFTDSVLRLLFAGDIDGDGKLDLVFDSHTWYESDAKTVFLSSLATDGIIVKAASFELSYDC